MITWCTCCSLTISKTNIKNPLHNKKKWKDIKLFFLCSDHTSLYTLLVFQNALLVSLVLAVQRDAPVRTVQDAIRRRESASVLQDGGESSVTKVQTNHQY